MNDRVNDDAGTSATADGAVPVGIDAQPVSAWLARNINGARDPFRFQLITGGHSNLTYRVTGADGTRYVLRRPPLGAVLATAHDMAREHRIVAAVARTTVPVPDAIGLCRDDSVNGAPFHIMSYVDGVVVHDDTIARARLGDHTTRAQLSRSVIAVLAELHRTDPDAIGLGDLGRKEAYLDRQLKRWKSQLESSRTRELPAMDAAYELLLAAKPQQRYTGVVHGDYRLGNMLVDPTSGTVAAVLDWELCTLGDVMADIGYLLNNWIEPGEELPRGATSHPTIIGGFLSRNELIRLYSEHTGFEVTNADYYRAFQFWRLAAIAEGVMARYLKGVMANDTLDIDQYRVQIDVMAAAALDLVRGLR